MGNEHFKILKKRKNQAKTLSVWIVLILILMMLKFFADGNSPSEQTFTIKELMKAAANDSILSLNIRNDPNGGANWYEVNGYIQNPHNIKTEPKIQLG